MVSDNLKREARKAWGEYGQAIVQAFRFPTGSAIVAEGVELMLANSTDERVSVFITWVGDQTNEMWSMRFIDER